MTDSPNPSPTPNPDPAMPPSAGAPSSGPPLNYAALTAGPTPYTGPAPDQDGKTMGMLCHLLGIFTGFVGPLILWLIKKDTSPFVNDQGKEALNWHITLLIVIVPVCIIGMLGMVVLHAFIIGCLLWLFIAALGIANLVFTIMGTVTANKGIAYRYPFALRLLK